jgi:hypothetical protein
MPGWGGTRLYATGGIKATISPFIGPLLLDHQSTFTLWVLLTFYLIGDQYSTMTPQLVITKTGERVVTDRMLTLQYIYNVFSCLRFDRKIVLELTFIFTFTSIATLSLIASTYLEKEVGFWAAYLLPLCSVWIVVPLLFF